jgi:hypothetical protein
MEQIQFKTIGEFLDFVELYNEAVKYNQQSFQYNTHQFHTRYAYYLIEYVKGSVGIDTVTIDNLLKHRAKANNNAV